MRVPVGETRIDAAPERAGVESRIVEQGGGLQGDAITKGAVLVERIAAAAMQTAHAELRAHAFLQQHLMVQGASRGRMVQRYQQCLAQMLDHVLQAEHGCYQFVGIQIAFDALFQRACETSGPRVAGAAPLSAGNASTAWSCSCVVCTASARAIPCLGARRDCRHVTQAASASPPRRVLQQQR